MKNFTYVYVSTNTTWLSRDRGFDRICTAKVKVKFTLAQATKAHRGSRGIALLFL